MAFRMDMATMNMEFRDANIIPRYNAAGVRKFAFSPASRRSPDRSRNRPQKAQQTYLTAYFGRRADALAWLAE